MKNPYKIVVTRKPESKRALWKLGHRWVDTIKIELKN
jgi:hypothetical protein